MPGGVACGRRRDESTSCLSLLPPRYTLAMSRPMCCATGPVAAEGTAAACLLFYVFIFHFFVPPLSFVAFSPFLTPSYHPYFSFISFLSFSLPPSQLFPYSSPPSCPSSLLSPSLFSSLPPLLFPPSSSLPSLLFSSLPRLARMRLGKVQLAGSHVLPNVASVPFYVFMNVIGSGWGREGWG